MRDLIIDQPFTTKPVGKILLLNHLVLDKTQQFIEKARIKHGDRYDYSKSKYVLWCRNIIIGCSVHGDFQQTPNNHLHGFGCGRCNKSRSASLAEFIEKSHKRHNDRYDYSCVNYINCKTKICIICPTHGEFWQDPTNHVRGYGCRRCGIERTSHITSIEKPLEGGYNLTTFERKPQLANSSGILYLMVLTTQNEKFLKIGITKRSLKARGKNLTRLSIRPILIFKGTLRSLYEIEQKTKNKYQKFKYEPVQRFCGHTECFEMEALPEIHEYLHDVRANYSDVI